MKTYQEQMLKLLVASAWELEEVESNVDWWATEHWRLKSTGPNWGVPLWITFLVDPHYDGQKKESAVWAIAATVERPTNRLQAEEGIALQALRRGAFDERVRALVRLINDERNRRGA